MGYATLFEHGRTLGATGRLNALRSFRQSLDAYSTSGLWTEEGPLRRKGMRSAKAATQTL